MMLFQYMIGNTDFSIYTLHNVHMVQTQAKVFYPIIWDFDISGLVNPLREPDPRLKIANLRERLYRGPCRSMTEYEPSLAVFRAKQAEALALLDSRAGPRRGAAAMPPGTSGSSSRCSADQDRLKRELVDKCGKASDVRSPQSLFFGGSHTIDLMPVVPSPSS